MKSLTKTILLSLSCCFLLCVGCGEAMDEDELGDDTVKGEMKIAPCALKGGRCLSSCSSAANRFPIPDSVSKPEDEYSCIAVGKELLNKDTTCCVSKTELDNFLKTHDDSSLDNS